MVKIDLITGFLGSGKTSFLKKYAAHCMAQGEHICILENDFGAVNVDMMLLQELTGDHCDMEMVAGGCDKDCHIRRFKTKLIAMGMCGYDRVIVEPSGIFDMDEFFDVLREDPLERWYEIDQVIAIVDAGLPDSLSEASEYVLASQIAHAGSLVFSKVQEVPDGEREEKKTELVQHIGRALKEIGANALAYRGLEHILWKDWKQLQEEDYAYIQQGHYQNASYVKRGQIEEEGFQTAYFMHIHMDRECFTDKVEDLFRDESYGHVLRVKGFMKEKDGWMEMNAVRDKIQIRPIPNGQEVIIVIGENLKQKELEDYWNQTR